MLCFLAAAAVSNFASAWYGPVTVTANVPFTGNPYDPDDNDVTVNFVRQDGQTIHRLAYFIGNGKFASTLVAPAPGKYTATFLRNGSEVGTNSSPVNLTTKLAHGFLGLKGRRFAWTDGSPYFPIGYDYGWKQANETVAQGMTRMGASGANWSRIWTSHWDNKNPFWPPEKEKMPGRELRQAPLQTWDGIFDAAEQAGVNFQFVLFHHGPYSTTTDSNWRDHPWNTANGGFLKDPTDFFSDLEAKKRAKIWLRYAVARYAHSPALMSWELFNEVQWVDAIKKNPKRTEDVAQWHREMADYIRSLDPYHHLVTSSSSESLDAGIFDKMDYLQPHTYPANVLAAIGGYEFKSKPGFFGEFGPPGGNRAGESYRKQVRDGIYGGMLAGHAGAGEYWYWDQVERNGLTPDFTAARKVIDQSGLLNHPNARAMSVWVATPKKTDLTLAAGGGWGKSTLFALNPPNVDVRSLGGWSQYFQSIEGGQKGWGKPFTISFVAPSSGKILLNVGQVSTRGGAITAFVNDKQVLVEKFPPTTTRTPRQPLGVDYPAGSVIVRLENHGEDWIGLNSITIPGIGATAFGHGMQDRDWALIRIFGTDTSKVEVSGLKLADGKYKARIFDTSNGEVKDRTIAIHKGAFSTDNLPLDSVLSISR